MNKKAKRRRKRTHKKYSIMLQRSQSFCCTERYALDHGTQHGGDAVRVSHRNMTSQWNQRLYDVIVLFAFHYDLDVIANYCYYSVLFFSFLFGIWCVFLLFVSFIFLFFLLGESDYD